MNPTRILTAGTLIALALVAASPLAAADDLGIWIDDSPDAPDAPDPEEVMQFVAEKCTEVLQQVQPGRRCDVG